VLEPAASHDGDMTTTPASAPTPALDRFFATLHRSPVTRSQDRVLAGVAAGVADRLGVSRAIVRVGAVILALLGPGVLLYLLAWLVLPDSQGRIRLERAVRGGDGGSVVLLVVAALSLFGALFGGSWDHDMGRMGGPGHGPGAWPFLVLAGVALIGWKKGWFGRRAHGPEGGPTPPATPTAPPAPPAPSTQGPQDAPRV
jgi:phage shock protein PspC (stress-responsive transcriptional regulator)